VRRAFKELCLSTLWCARARYSAGTLRFRLQVQESFDVEYVSLGTTGLKVSKICLGCMSYGEPERGNQTWSLGKKESEPFFRQALDAGINFFDTANVYSAGSSEEITGPTLLSMAPREELVIATKVNGRMRPGPNGEGLSRKAILTEIDESLRRLGTDYVDLYQIHRWDYNTPIEETMEALHDVVKAGKARYIGASSMYTWQFAQAQYTADLNGWTRFVSMQNYYNLLYREEEREMLPFCLDQGVGSIPWSPLARGRLTRPWEQQTNRSENDPFGRSLSFDMDRPIVDTVIDIAGRRGVAPAQVALAWVLSKPAVTSPIVGATKAQHLTDAIAAVDLHLDDAEIASLEKDYLPHRTVGFI
jgi:aryl-alcohol dehydrogenase-like predicted oxidoreductase